MKNLNFIFFPAIIILFGYFTFNLFFSSLTYNVNTPSLTTKLLFNLAAPEGWGFFTKDPREEIVDIYRIEENGNLKKELVNNNHSKNTFGASRKSRRVGMELSMILNQIPDSIWVKEHDISNFKIPETSDVVIRNDYLKFISNGDYVLIKRNIVPWAWRKNINKKDIPYEIVKIKI